MLLVLGPESGRTERARRKDPMKQTTGRASWDLPGQTETCTSLLWTTSSTCRRPARDAYASIMKVRRCVAQVKDRRDQHLVLGTDLPEHKKECSLWPPFHLPKLTQQSLLVDVNTKLGEKGREFDET